MLTRLVVYAVLGLVLDAVGAGFNTWGFWSILALVWAAEHLTRTEAYRDGVAQGVQVYMAMTPEQQLELKRKIKEIEDAN